MAERDDWQVATTVYLWGASLGGTANFPIAGTSADFNIDAKQLLNNLNFGGMALFDVHKGSWGFMADVMYLNVGASKSGTKDFQINDRVPPATVSADLHLGVKSWISTIAGEYRVLQEPDWTLDVLAGGRYLDVNQKLDYTLTGDLGPLPLPEQSGSSTAGGHFWDGIVGVKGQYAFGPEERWSVPFYLDGGAGQSRYTYQAALGIAYSFRWGDISALWRYLDYKTHTSQLENIYFNGPVIGATFRW